MTSLKQIKADILLQSLEHLWGYAYKIILLSFSINSIPAFFSLGNRTYKEIFSVNLHYGKI